MRLAAVIGVLFLMVTASAQLGDVQAQRMQQREERKRDDGLRRLQERARKALQRESSQVTPGPGLIDRRTPDARESLRATEARDNHQRIFAQVRDGITKGDIGMFSTHFASQLLCNLRGGESGYYSANQAYYVLENYLRTRRVVSSDFSTVGESGTNPYATGSVTFNVKGSREVAQIYVSLSLAGDRWVISQINIY